MLSTSNYKLILRRIPLRPRDYMYIRVLKKCSSYNGLNNSITRGLLFHITKRFGNRLWIWRNICTFSWLTSFGDRAAPSWALSRTALSQAQCCPGQRLVRLSVALDSAESGWTLPWTALSQAERCPGLHWVRLSLALESAELGWTLPWTALSQA